MHKSVLALFLTLISGAAFAQDAIGTETPIAADQVQVAPQNMPATMPAGEMTPPSSPATAGTPAELQPIQYEQMKYAVLQTLDKVTARTSTSILTVGQPAGLGPIFIDVKTCQKTPPNVQPEAAAFLQVWEAKPKAYGKQSEETKSQWVFSGWMFASSPALSGMNHPIYDVWVKDCINELPKEKSTEKSAQK